MQQRRSRRKEVMALAAEEQQRRSRRKEVMVHAAEEIEKERSHGTCSRGDIQQRRSKSKEVIASSKAIAGQMIKRNRHRDASRRRSRKKRKNCHRKKFKETLQEISSGNNLRKLWKD
jgi:hypothetical protein